MGVTKIRANTILPARREDIELHTADGLTLVGELALPADRDPVATLVCLHPLPTHGGMMDSHVFRKAAWRLPALAGVAVLRFNTRGTSSVRGTSAGTFDGGVGERHDVVAAIEYAEFAELPRIWLLGWSFGTDLALRYGNDPAIVGAILLSPPLRSATVEALEAWAGLGEARHRPRARVRRLPSAGRGAAAVRRDPPGGGGGYQRAPSTSGSATRRPSSTRSSSASRRTRIRSPPSGTAR